MLFVLHFSLPFCSVERPLSPESLNFLGPNHARSSPSLFLAYKTVPIRYILERYPVTDVELMTTSHYTPSHLILVEHTHNFGGHNLFFMNSILTMDLALFLPNLRPSSLSSQQLLIVGFHPSFPVVPSLPSRSTSVKSLRGAPQCPPWSVRSLGGRTRVHPRAHVSGASKYQKYPSFSLGAFVSKGRTLVGTDEASKFPCLSWSHVCGE